MRLFRPVSCLALAALLAAGPSPAAAAGTGTISITNDSPYPLLGFERVSVEPDKVTFSERVTIFLDKPLMPGASVTVENPVDRGLAARGGEQQLRWHWTANRACMGFAVVDPAGRAQHFTAGRPTCKPMPTDETIILIPGIQAVDAFAAKGDLTGAIFAINAMLRHYPGLPLLLHRRGELFLQANLPDRAEEDFGAETGADAGHAFHDMAMVHFARGDGHRALQLLDGAVRHSPKNLQYLSDRAQVACLAGDIEQVRKDDAAIAALGGPPPQGGRDCAPQDDSGW